MLRPMNAQGVGGYAFGVPAEPRATKDRISSSARDEENSKAVFRALAQYGAALDGVSPADFMDGSTFQIGQPPARIDILQRIDGVTFDEAWENRIEGHIDDEIRTSVISRENLIQTRPWTRAGHIGCKEVACCEQTRRRRLRNELWRARLLSSFRPEPRSEATTAIQFRSESELPTLKADTVQW